MPYASIAMSYGHILTVTLFKDVVFIVGKIVASVEILRYPIAGDQV